ncbi:MAG TPA: Bor family protein [Longimicrobiales bacterium]|nr:Bor family protein [Longimicrobiales bacterium]
MHRRMSVVALAVVFSAGCYHATINTGLAPSGETVEQQWAHSFIGGLVPPATVETASRCPNGVSKVETKHSFLNMLAAGITGGLYSPMTITVSCAAARGGDDATALVVPANTSVSDAAAAFGRAVEQSRVTGEAVLVRFE